MTAVLPGSNDPVVPPRVARDYAEWLAQALPDAPTDAYYTEPRARFELRDDDVLAVPGDVHVGKAACGASVSSARAGASLEVCGVKPAEVARVIGAVDGVRTAREVRLASSVDAASWQELTAALFGTVVFAPLAVAALESSVPSAEIARFPGSPYEIVRPYWENMARVRARLQGAAAVASGGDTADFVRWLRALHAVVLTGEGSTFYRPASPIALKERFAPGELATAPSVTEETARGIRFVSGLRVSASPLGGPHYVPLLLESAGGEAPSASQEAGPAWGAVVTARADADPAPAAWFCPPRPLEARHFDALRSHLAAALSAEARGEAGVAVERAARFHHAFVRLHPFGFANQCLAMALVNRALSPVLGGGLSHLVLDHLALELPADVYVEVFLRATAAWLSKDPNPVHRTLELAQKKARCFAFVRALSAAQRREEARRLVQERREDARLAFF